MSNPLNFAETSEHRDLRKAVASLGEKYGAKYMYAKADAGEYPMELWKEAGELGFIGVNLPEEYGGGGAGITELAIVQRELATHGAPLLMLVVSPAIIGTIINTAGTEEQKQRWLPGIASGEYIAAFGITEPDAGTNTHKITTTAHKENGEWVISGQKTFISGVDVADSVLIVARVKNEETGKYTPGLFMVPTNSDGFTAHQIPMEVKLAEWQFQLFLDEVRIPEDNLIGSLDTGMTQLFMGLNPERIMATAMAVGSAEYALRIATEYAKTRAVFGQPIGAHQGVAHPLAQCRIELEMAKLMGEKAASLFDAGDIFEAANAANMAKYAAGEISAKALDQSVQTLGGNGLTTEYGLARMFSASRLGRIAPVSREMILNYVSQNMMGLPKSY